MSEAFMSRKVYTQLVVLTARYFILGKYQLVGKGVLLLELLIAAYLKKRYIICQKYHPHLSPKKEEKEA